MIKLLLLLSLSFNIAHASIIAIVDDCTECHNNTLYDYVYETNVVSDTADLCTMHHFFHFTAIISSAVTFPDVSLSAEQPAAKYLDHQPPFEKTFYRPPIA